MALTTKYGGRRTPARPTKANLWCSNVRNMAASEKIDVSGQYSHTDSRQYANDVSYVRECEAMRRADIRREKYPAGNTVDMCVPEELRITDDTTASTLSSKLDALMAKYAQ